MLIAVVAFGTVSCRQSDLEKETAIIENQPATLTLNIDGANFSSVATRTASTENEIRSLVLFVFTKEGKLLSRSFFEEAPSSQIKVKTTSGKDMRVVAVANYKAIEGLEEQLATAANYDVLTDIVVTQSATSPGSSAGILMTGETIADITDSPSGTSIALTMQYAVVKVTLSIKVNSAALAADETIDIIGLRLGSIATNGFLMPKANEPAERHYTELDSISYSGNQNDGIIATFYVLENIRGGRKQIAYPEGIIEDSSNGHLFKRHFAPDNSSYAVINANHRKNGDRAKLVDMYIYFGHNSSDNYDVARSESHIYTIRINGLNNINIDTNIETSEVTLDYSYSDNLNFDAHADNRNISFAKATGSIDVEVIDNSGRRFSDAGFDATWVKISPLDLMKHQVRLKKGGSTKYDWQQTGEKDEIVRGKYIPHHSVREKLPYENWNIIAVGTENDDQLSFADATYRMCYAITSIPLDEARQINIYADENTTDAQRSAKIEIRYKDKNGQTQKEVLSISQVALHPVGSIGGYQLLIESFEEYSFNIYPAPAKQLTKSNGMNWGFYDNQIYIGAAQSGDFLTANAVYGLFTYTWVDNGTHFIEKDINGAPTWRSGNLYRTKYGATDLTLDWDNSLGTTAAPYNYPNYNSTQQFYSPIYNSAAARYCHEKNRDLDGDGQISPSEATWFLPSQSELLVIAQNSDQLPSEAKFETVYGSYYWSSTELDSKTALGFDFRQKVSGQYRKSVANRIRCVRRGKKVKTPIVSVDGNNSVVVDNNDLRPDQITTTPKSFIPATESSNKTISSRFIVARRDAVQMSSWTNAAGMSDVYIPLQLGDNLGRDKASGCAIYSELADGSDKGKWRLPTKSELSRISEHLQKLEAIAGFTPFANTWYWSATEVPNYNVYNSWAAKPRNNLAQSFGRATLNNARCIQQL